MIRYTNSKVFNCLNTHVIKLLDKLVQEKVLYSIESDATRQIFINVSNVLLPLNREFEMKMENENG